jgi:hypothetical protein
MDAVKVNRPRDWASRGDDLALANPKPWLLAGTGMGDVFEARRLCSRGRYR